jgi:hypothetical protein
LVLSNGIEHVPFEKEKETIEVDDNNMTTENQDCPMATMSIPTELLYRAVPVFFGWSASLG